MSEKVEDELYSRLEELVLAEAATWFSAAAVKALREILKRKDDEIARLNHLVDLMHVGS